MFRAPRLTTEVCYRPGAAARSDAVRAFWYGRCLSSCRRLGAVSAVCRSSALALPAGSVARAISRSRCCFQRAGSVSSWAPPVGRGSWGLMPLAARHTAISRMRAVLGWLPGGSPDWLGRHLGRRGLGSGRRGRRLVGIALPGSRPRRDGHAALVECPGSQGSGPGSIGCELWEAPVEDGGHVACGFEVASAGSCQQVAEWVLTGFGREGEQVGPQGRPSRFSGESGNVLVGLVELCDGLGSDELFGCDVEAVGVALDRLEEPGRWVVELAQQGGGGDGRFIAGKDLLQRLGRRAR